MKFALSQLRKFELPYHFEYDYNLMENLKHKDDILDVLKCHIDGAILHANADRVEVELEVDCVLKMQCAISLEEVIYPLNFSSTVMFDYYDDDSYPIDGQTVNIDNAVLSEIVINLPYRVVKDEYLDLDTPV